MKGNYRSERHRRKVMREMRLAGYELPQTPYIHVNRVYVKNVTSKVQTSPKMNKIPQKKQKTDFWGYPKNQSKNEEEEEQEEL